MEYKPARFAGIQIEPPVSVPMDKGANPADTPTPDPEDEPPGPERPQNRSSARNLPTI